MAQQEKPAVAIYARVSTEDQNCDMQLAELRDYARRAGWDAPADYMEKASGKAGARRPVQRQLLADAQMRKIDVLLVWKLDRFGRSLQDLIANIQILDQSGVRLIIPSQGIDTDNKSPMGRFVIGILGLLAEFERSIIAERTAAGRAQFQRDFAAGRIGKEKHTRSGKDLPNGRPKKIFRRDEALRLRQEGKSLRAIAAVLEVPFTTVADALKSLRKS
ncbi:MAG TPA: recombinase family protein [Bryobacteraceae bacterium]|nr:recombinase family protein [Bryobacteraceae bacterium]